MSRFEHSCRQPFPVREKQRERRVARTFVALILLWAATASQAEEPKSVSVTNFPEQQEVTGVVAIEKPIPHSEIVRFEQQVVSPVSRNEFTNLNEVGQVEMAGFTTVVVSLVGEVKGSTAHGGNVGLLLIPDEEPILRAFRENGETLLALELEAAFEAGSIGTFATQEVQAIGFPRYRIFLYNESRNSVTANTYIYLRH